VNRDRRNDLVRIIRLLVDIQRMIEPGIALRECKGEYQRQASEECGCGDEYVSRHFP
jgi:hypothetical protein